MLKNLRKSSRIFNNSQRSSKILKSSPASPSLPPSYSALIPLECSQMLLFSPAQLISAQLLSSLKNDRSYFKKWPQPAAFPGGPLPKPLALIVPEWPQMLLFSPAQLISAQLLSSSKTIEVISKSCHNQPHFLAGPCRSPWP